MTKIQQTKAELEEHFNDHIFFIKSSAASFDDGSLGEAKRIAVSLRVLFRDTGRSHSLLGQLNRLTGRFISTASPHVTENLSTHGGLIMTASKGLETTYYAPLDNSPFHRWLPFQDWWDEIVFVDDRQASLTRKDLILTMAEQDGGAHVDPSISEVYARLSRHNSMGWVIDPSGKTIPNAERAAIRQIAHEVLKTLDAKYQKKPNISADFFSGYSTLVIGDKVPELPLPQKFSRNEKCPCGNGKKYKVCHGF